MSNYIFYYGTSGKNFSRKRDYIFEISIVNLAHTPAQKLQGTATMSELPHTTGWSADKVADGNTTQTATGGSCAIMDFDQHYKSVWLKVLLERLFNVAYIELYLRNEKRTLTVFKVFPFRRKTLLFLYFFLLLLSPQILCT